jgi:hypothetical protein
MQKLKKWNVYIIFFCIPYNLYQKQVFREESMSHTQVLELHAQFIAD